MTVAELLNSLCKKAGIADTNQHLKNILSSAELSKMEVNKEISDALEGNLLSEDAAMAHTGIRTKLREKLVPEILNGIDSEMDNLVTAAGFDPDDIAEFKKADTSYKRMRAIATKIDGLIKKKAGTKDGADKEGLTKQIEKLHEALAEQKTQFETKLKEESEKFASREEEFHLEGMLGEHTYANEVVGKRANVITAKTVLNEKLAQAGAKLVRNNGQWEVVKQDGTPFYNDKHVKVDAKTFTEQAIAPLLKVADPNAGKGAGSGSGGAGQGSSIPDRTGGARSMDAAFAELGGS